MGSGIDPNVPGVGKVRSFDLDDEPIPGATDFFLSVVNATCDDEGSYRVDLTNDCSFAQSESVSISVAGCTSVIDCNSNGIDDAIDISSGTSADCDGNGVPDECDTCTLDCQCNDGAVCTVDECNGGSCTNTQVLYGDIDANGFTNLDDVLCILDTFGGNPDPAGCRDRKSVV